MDYIEAVRLARAGNERGFAYLYENTYKSKYYLALQYMKNEDAAEDVLQDAYLKAFSKLDTLEQPEHFPAWLGQIVANTAKNALAKNNPLLFTDVAAETEIEDFVDRIEDDNITGQPELSYTREETRVLVRELIDALSEEQRMCILLFHIEGVSIKEIAQTLGCSENTVKSRLNYGRKNLKIKAEELQKKGYKLYNIAPLPLLLLLLRTDREVMAAEGGMQAVGRSIAEYVFARVSVSDTTSDGAKAASDAARTGQSQKGTKAGGASKGAQAGSTSQAAKTDGTSEAAKTGGTPEAARAGSASKGEQAGGTSKGAKAGGASKAAQAGSASKAAQAGVSGAAKATLLHVTAGKAAAVILGLCLAGGAIYGATQMAGKEDVPEVPEQVFQTAPETQPEPEAVPEIPAETGPEEAEQPVMVVDADYPELLEGNLTKEELEFILAYGPETLSEEGLSERDYLNMLNCWCQASEAAGGLLTFVGSDANYRQGYLVDTINRYLSSFTDYRFTEENDSDTPYGVDVDGDTIWITPAELSFEAETTITDAAYLGDTMMIHFTYEKNSYENGITAAEKTAALKKTAEEKFRIVTIEGGYIPLEEMDTGTETPDETEKSGNEDSIRAIYEGVLQSVQAQEAGYDLPNANGSEDFQYFLWDMDGDGIKELIVGAMFTEDVFDAYDIRVFTVARDSSGYTLKSVSGDMVSLALYLPEDGKGLYTMEMSRGTGETNIYRITIEDDALIKGSSPELTYTMGDSTGTDFIHANDYAEWMSVSSTDGLTELE